MNGALNNSTIASGSLCVKQRLPQTQPNTRKQRLPSCFDDHGAARSIVQLFTAWVQKADQTSNGIISINLRAQAYSHTTVTRAINWLVKHRLMLRTESGGGRGVGSRYFVRWSFDHKALSARQKAVNHPETRITGNPSPIEETHKGNSHKWTHVPGSPNAKALAWAMAQLRRELEGYQVTPQRRRFILTGIGSSLWRGMKSGAIRAGRQLAAFLHEIIQRLREAQGVRESQRAWCSWGGWAVRGVIDDECTKRASDEASARRYAQSQREREEAKGGVTAFLSEVGAARMRDYIHSLTGDRQP